MSEGHTMSDMDDLKAFAKRATPVIDVMVPEHDKRLAALDAASPVLASKLEALTLQTQKHEALIAQAQARIEELVAKK